MGTPNNNQSEVVNLVSRMNKGGGASGTNIEILMGNIGIELTEVTGIITGIYTEMTGIMVGIKMEVTGIMADIRTSIMTGKFEAVENHVTSIMAGKVRAAEKTVQLAFWLLK